MSTDIGALQKQYARLKKNQHHACVVISDIRTGRGETDVNADPSSPVSPGAQTGVGSPHVDHDQMEGSVAMLTLSVPIETETKQPDLMDPLSPTVFGETKCFFVQNVKKKKKIHSRRSSKTADTILDKSEINPTSAEITGTDDKSTENDTEPDGEDTRLDKRVSFNENIEVVTNEELDKNSIRNNRLTIQGKEADDNTGNETEVGQSDVKDEQEIHENNDDSNDIPGQDDSVREVTTENDTDPSRLTSDKTCDGAEQNLNGLCDDNVEKSEIEEKVEGQTKSKMKAKEGKGKHPGILKNSRTQGVRNPSVKFSKQFYPSSRTAVYKKHRTNSAELNESSNKQSIYQHFMMTKRQLSLDSALTVEGNTATSSMKSIEFPFPIHTVNEHRIKAGMKLGLYDQKALEKIEKTKKVFKSKLPHLT